MPDGEEARNGIATHIRKFWDPRMRREMYQHIDSTAGDGLHPLVLDALRLHREDLLPATV
jgi:formate dehydrogenase subunit delta